MQPTLINDWYISTDQRLGAWSVTTETPTAEQKTNANIVRSFFINEGWTIEAICGMLGCMQGESTINPAFIQATNRYRLPNSAANLTDVPNSVAKHYFKEYYQDTRQAYGLGLVQWDGYSQVTISGTTEDQQKMVAYAIRNNIIWYDGWTQLYRLKGEQEYDTQHGTTSFFRTVRWNGTDWNFTNYPTSTMSPEDCASVFTYGYERNAGGPGFRTDNARWWYDWFTGEDAPDIIEPEDFSEPLEADPDEPPFDPDDPQPVDPSGPEDYLPAWLLCVLKRNRKEIKQIWRRI